jgi:lipoprotein-anchoring transpeptidase ErfK/SrfK
LGLSAGGTEERDAGSSAGLIAMHAQLTEDDVDAGPLTPRTLTLVDALRPFFPEAAPPATIDEAYALLIAGRLEEARAAFAAIAEMPGLTLVERFRVKLGTAQSLASLGHRSTATTLSVELLAESTPVIPAPWRDAAARLNEVLALGRLDLDAQLLSSEVTFGSESAADADPQPPAAGVFIDIDKTDFTLTVFRDGKRETSYPIGLGIAGSTPEGRFTIANKIGRPTWYNKGDPVAPGDPRNPLGDHWLGLAAERLATAYGIHGTTEPSSIGDEASAGCIRMRPDDVAAVFGAAEVGTPVFIHP